MDLVCFSHLRWDFVFQRPQHLLTRFSNIYRVFYIEEPLFDSDSDYLSIVNNDRVWIIRMHLKNNSNETDMVVRQRRLLNSLFRKMDIIKYIFWYYTPMAFPLREGTSPELVIYDCMDELANFRFAPSNLLEYESLLMNEAHLVFTGGKSLFNKKKHRNASVYCFPSSIDKNHFSKAQNFIKDPSDQENIPHPRLGYFGVLDERLDTNLIKQMALKRPEWQFIFVGPVTKISTDTLPDEKNIHYLGRKDYKDLPAYLAGWDIALMPFAINDSTEFISPTKTPEYLSAHKPVISTPITDVVHPYGELELVNIASTADKFIVAAEKEINSCNEQWKKNVDTFLSEVSWDITFQKMYELVKQRLSNNHLEETIKEYA
jgi:UDP-galactopyranose mutase